MSLEELGILIHLVVESLGRDDGEELHLFTKRFINFYVNQKTALRQRGVLYYYDIIKLLLKIVSTVYSISALLHQKQIITIFTSPVLSNFPLVHLVQRTVLRPNEVPGPYLFCCLRDLG